MIVESREIHKENVSIALYLYNICIFIMHAERCSVSVTCQLNYEIAHTQVRYCFPA